MHDQWSYKEQNILRSTTICMLSTTLDDPGELVPGNCHKLTTGQRWDS